MSLEDKIKEYLTGYGLRDIDIDRWSKDLAEIAEKEYEELKQQLRESEEIVAKFDNLFVKLGIEDDIQKLLDIKDLSEIAEKENADLKNQLKYVKDKWLHKCAECHVLKEKIDSIKYLDRGEVDFALGQLIESIHSKRLIDVARDKALDAICPLALKIDRDKVVEVIKDTALFTYLKMSGESLKDKELRELWKKNVKEEVEVIADNIIKAIGGK